MLSKAPPPRVFLLHLHVSFYYYSQYLLILWVEVGGLALLWLNKNALDIFNYSRFHINAVVKDLDGNEQWRFTGFYGQPDSAKRMESWALLKHLSRFQPLPWLCAGDFNEILEQQENEGATLRRETQMNNFRQCLEVCGLGDLGFIGPCFTWNNGREDEDFIQERLDRAMANREWSLIFPFVTVTVLAASRSDHNPILIQYSEFQEERQQYRRGFKFEEAWTKDVEYSSIVQSAWGGNSVGESDIQAVQTKLSSCQHTLSWWSKKKFGQSEENLKRKKKQLLDLQSVSRPGTAMDIKRIKAEIDEILLREDLHWKQRSKHNWYQNGDRNTQFFHSWANHRWKTNTIRSITDGAGRV
jgi:hypothetical protein